MQNTLATYLVATFRDWQKGFCIALRKFGEEHLADINSEDALGLFVRDKEFLGDYAKALETARPTLAHYRRFAHLWDKFYVPLRFWKKTPAWNLMRHRYHYAGDDKEFTRNFYSQKADPKNKRAPGLVGLKPHMPELVVKWEEQRTPRITISVGAAERHGFILDRCCEALEASLEAKVYAK